jgi:hypothetical protein
MQHICGKALACRPPPLHWDGLDTYSQGEVWGHIRIDGEQTKHVIAALDTSRLSREGACIQPLYLEYDEPRRYTSLVTFWTNNTQ